MSGAMERKEQYWLEKFGKVPSGEVSSEEGAFLGEIPVLELPVDFIRPSVRSFEGNKLCYKLDTAMSSGLDSLARKNKTSNFTLLLSAYYVLLKKYTGQEDIIVGTSASGRIHPDLAGAVGMFVAVICGGRELTY
jgi:bacitracin synthase 2